MFLLQVWGLFLEAPSTDPPNAATIRELIQSQISQGLRQLGCISTRFPLRRRSITWLASGFSLSAWVNRCLARLNCDSTPKDEHVVTCACCRSDYKTSAGFEPDDDENPFYEKYAAQNLAFMMYRDYKKVGCAVSTSCTSGHSAVVCLFSDDGLPNPPPHQDVFT